MVTLPNPFNSVSAISAEGVAIVAPESAPVSVAAVASNSELSEGPVVAPPHTESFAARSLGPGRKKDQASFQPDFEKLFNTIFELSDMEAVLICADEALRVETLLSDMRAHT